jgi:site-specific DNA recombinase
MTRAAGYVRVSTSRQAEEGLSLEAQEKRVRDYIEAQGWELDAIYVERGVSGKRDDRPELRRLMGSLEAIDRLVIPKLDRLGRSTKHLHETFEALSAAGVELVSLADQIDTSTPAGRLMRNMMVSLAEFESDNIGERVRSVTASRVEQGKHHGRAPYGYESRDGELLPKEPEASVVRRIFEEFVGGRSQRAIQRALNSEGIRSKAGRDWTQGTISKLLANSTYRGAVELSGTEYPGTHEPLVSIQTWQRAAKTREAMARTTGKGRGRPSRGSHLFTRSLELRCGHCGNKMIPRSDSDKYLCFGREKHGIDYCPMTPVPRNEVDRAVFDYFQTVGLDLEAMREQLRAAAASKSCEVEVLLRDAERAEREVADAITRAKRDYGRGALDAETYTELVVGYKSEHTASEANVKQLQGRAEQIRAAERTAGDGEAEVMARLAQVRAAVSGEVRSASDLEAVRAALARMFEEFTIARPAADTLDALSDVERSLVEQQEREFPRDDVPTLAVGQWELIPLPRDEVVAGIEDETWEPILRREALAFSANNDAVSLHR